MGISRRIFSRSLAGLGILGLPERPAAGNEQDLQKEDSVERQARRGRQERTVFRHGVASGDPLTDAVILWTRITPGERNWTRAVRWVVATDPKLRNVVRRGSENVQPNRDFTVKIDVNGLQPGTTYYYQFRTEQDESLIGRTRTLPTLIDRLRIGVASCSNMPFGYFNSYRALANRSDLDCVLHLGDYIYEYGNRGFGDGAALGRIPEPDHEILSLGDYRTRYAQYRRDPDLQELHRQHAMIIVWDDHEIANDSYNNGADNHDEGEGTWEDRKKAAVRAWNEWQPIRETALEQTGRIYRSFRFGDLADLIMLDTRNADRDQQVAANSPLLADPSRSLLGEEQEAWLYAQLTASQQSGRRWRLLGQQVMMAQLVSNPTTIFNPDQWDGYLASRNRLLTHIAQNGIGNVVVLTGDIHSSWASDITPNPFSSAYNGSTGTGSLAVEFVTPGITSPAIESAAQAAALRAQVLASHPHIKLLDLYERGYMVLDITADRTQTEWYHPLTLTTRNAVEKFGGAMQVMAGNPHLVAATGPLAPKPSPDPAP
jgi:alkaline phosphatase D